MAGALIPARTSCSWSHGSWIYIYLWSM